MTGSRCSRSMNAESLVEDGLGLIREIREQNARESVILAVLVEKNGHVERVCPQIPGIARDFKDAPRQEISIRLNFVRVMEIGQDPPYLALTHRYCMGRPENLLAEQIPFRDVFLVPQCIPVVPAIVFPVLPACSKVSFHNTGGL